MRKFFVLCLLGISLTLLLGRFAFAHCGVCKGSLVYAQEGAVESIKGKIICLGCTLKKEQGAKAQCSIYGHTNGLRTTYGKIWTFLENDNATKLINDHDLVGKAIEIKGKKFEDANYIEIESYKILEE